MWSSPLLVLLLFAVVVRTTARPSSTVPNRTLPYPRLPRSAEANTPLMLELLGPDGGRRTLKAYDGQYLTEHSMFDLLTTRRWSRAHGQYWNIEQINDYEVALRENKGRYVSNRTHGAAGYAWEARDWEMLTPVKNDDGTWSFQARDGRWMSAYNPHGGVHFMPENLRCERWVLESW